MNYAETLSRLYRELQSAEAILIGAGAGLSTSAGFTYSGLRFTENFADMIERYGFTDMYSAGFYPFKTPEEMWAYWSRFIFINRYDQIAGQPYLDLLELIIKKNFFVLTTNTDHRFQEAGFPKDRIFYTQGDFGLFQCAKPCHKKTYNNEAVIRQMIAEQKDCRIPGELVPHCPVCGGLMSMNLRSDDTFVEDEDWHKAAIRYEHFLQEHGDKHILYLELGVGGNTPGIIKYNFWKLTFQNTKAIYTCINLTDVAIPKGINKQSICIQDDIGKILKDLKEIRKL